LQLEQRFGFQIKIDDIDLDDLRTLARIARLVAARTAGAGSQVTPLAGRAETNRAFHDRFTARFRFRRTGAPSGSVR